MEPHEDALIFKKRIWKQKIHYLETCDVAVMSWWQDRGRCFDRRICVGTIGLSNSRRMIMMRNARTTRNVVFWGDLRMRLTVDIHHALEPLEPALLSFEALSFALLTENGLEVFHPPIHVLGVFGVLERAREMEV